MHRSGTSLLSQIMYRSGIYLGKDNELDFTTNGNQDGHFEHIRIRQIHDEMLLEMGMTWCSMIDYGETFCAFNVDVYKAKLKNELDRLFIANDIVCIKDPRMALFLPLWEQIVNEEKIEPVYLYVRRRADEVAASLNKRDRIPIDYGIQLWKQYNVYIQLFLKNKRFFELSFEELFEDEIGPKISEYIFGKNVYENDMGRIVKREYRHNYSNELGVPLDDECKKLFDLIIAYDELKRIKQNLSQMSFNYERRIKDSDLIEQEDFFIGKRIIIYGAGNYGRKAVKMLRKMGIFDFVFCDRDPAKINTVIDNVRVYGIDSIANDCNVCVIVAIADEYMVRFLMRYFGWLDKIEMCSYEALEKRFQGDFVEYGIHE